MKTRPRQKPPQPTIVKRSTARNILYLQRKGLASFKGCNLVTPATHYRRKNPINGEVVTEKINDGSPTCGA